MNLSTRQKRVLGFLAHHQSETDSMPSYATISCAMGWTSANAAREVVFQLIEAGFLEAIPRGFRFHEPNRTVVLWERTGPIGLAEERVR